LDAFCSTNLLLTAREVAALLLAALLDDREKVEDCTRPSGPNLTVRLDTSARQNNTDVSLFRSSCRTMASGSRPGAKVYVLAQVGTGGA
jgi:hypothetical protein